MSSREKLTQEQAAKLFQTLKTRFEKHPNRHQGLEWNKVLAKLEALYTKQDIRLWSLQEMENTGGEPDVVVLPEGKGFGTDEFIFIDCSAESPSGRRSTCYDREALDSRKENKPAANALDMASQMGIELLSEDQYRALQQLGKFDLKTSSWIKTPAAIRKLGGALFCDRRYDHVFTYHNGVQSYYAARGFRGLLRI